MKNLFSGSPFFMVLLTLTLTILVARFIYDIINTSKKKKEDIPVSYTDKYLLSIGLLAIVLGVLHQLIAWYSMITAIKDAGDITTDIVLTALKMNMIPLIYGTGIFLLSLLLWIFSRLFFKTSL